MYTKIFVSGVFKYKKLYVTRIFPSAHVRDNFGRETFCNMWHKFQGQTTACNLFLVAFVTAANIADVKGNHTQNSFT